VTLTGDPDSSGDRSAGFPALVGPYAGPAGAFVLTGQKAVVTFTTCTPLLRLRESGLAALHPSVWPVLLGGSTVIDFTPTPAGSGTLEGAPLLDANERGGLADLTATSPASDSGPGPERGSAGRIGVGEGLSSLPNILTV